MLRSFEEGKALCGNNLDQPDCMDYEKHSDYWFLFILSH